MKKIAIVTGSSRGIGAATAIRLAADGYDICVNYVSSKKAAHKVVDKVRACGVRAIAVSCDVSDEGRVVALFETVIETLGTPSVLVNNAAILFEQGRIADMDAKRLNAVLATNVTGCFLCCREAIACMSTAHGGSGGVIVNVSSAAARLGSPGEYIDYAASKGAVDTLTRGLALEVADEGIRVNGVRPGLIYTDMHASGGEPRRVERLKASVPLQRGGTAEEVAAAISWLVSEESSYTTGAFIEVSGGR